RVLFTVICGFFFFSSRRRHTRWPRDWSSDVCSSDLVGQPRRRQLAMVEPPGRRSISLADGRARPAAPASPAGRPDPQAAGGLSEIGRASCRERVLIFVVVGSLLENLPTGLYVMLGPH